MGKTSVESLRSYIKYSKTQLERYEKDYSRARHIIASEKENIKNLREQIRKLNGE